MKTLLLTLGAALLLTSAAQAQEMTAAQVPAARATFKARFPTVRRTTWGKEGAAFEADFKLNSKTMSAVSTPAGALQETETDLRASALPAAVRATLARDCRADEVSEAATIAKADGTTADEAEGGKKQDVLFTAAGKVAPN